MDNKKNQLVEPSLREYKFTFLKFPQFLILLLIRIYQEIISPNLPANTCRFYPTCSHYGYQAIYKYGVAKGGWMTVKRLLRCNPFNSGGYDPVP